MLQKSARVPSKWCGETFSHYFNDGTVLRCQITRHVVHELACLLFKANAPVRRGFPQIIFEKCVILNSSNIWETVLYCACGRFLMLREFLTKERCAELIFCACKTPYHMQDLPIQPLSSTPKFLF